MKSLLITTLFIFLVSLVSCDSNPDNKKQAVDLPAATNSPTLPSSTKNENTTSNNAALPVLNNTPQVTLNPEHGKPGHRCDITVGAPLTNAPANKTATPITNSNTPTNSVGLQPSVPITTVAPGMNPQHGQPGHRCDVAVGAPLASKPKQ